MFVSLWVCVCVWKGAPGGVKERGGVLWAYDPADDLYLMYRWILHLFRGLPQCRKAMMNDILCINNPNIFCSLTLYQQQISTQDISY